MWSCKSTNNIYRNENVAYSNQTTDSPEKYIFNVDHVRRNLVDPKREHKEIQKRKEKGKNGHFREHLKCIWIPINGFSSLNCFLVIDQNTGWNTDRNGNFRKNPFLFNKIMAIFFLHFFNVMHSGETILSRIWRSCTVSPFNQFRENWNNFHFWPHAKTQLHSQFQTQSVWIYCISRFCVLMCVCFGCNWQ